LKVPTRLPAELYLVHNNKVAGVITKCVYLKTQEKQIVSRGEKHWFKQLRIFIDKLLFWVP